LALLRSSITFDTQPLYIFHLGYVLTLQELQGLDLTSVKKLFYQESRIRRKSILLPCFQKDYDRIYAPVSKVNITFYWYADEKENPDGVLIKQSLPCQDFRYNGSSSRNIFLSVPLFW